MERQTNGSAGVAACSQVPREAWEDDVTGGAGLGRRRRAALWAAALFNTRTRLRYPAPRGRGWCPGDELALCHFTDAALDGRLQPHFRSQEQPHASARAGGPPPGVTELVGSTFGHEAIEPVAAGLAEVLLLVYAPWCSHSLNFIPLWKSLAASVSAMASEDRDRGREGGLSESPSPLLPESLSGDEESSVPVPSPQAGRLLLAQMDGTQNEHPDLPHVGRFPTIFLGVRSPAQPVGNATRAQAAKQLPEGGAQPPWEAPSPGPAVRFLVYGGDASLSGLRAWVARHSVLKPPLGGAEL
mmetsp:Transcript_106114/g.332633  ORF Transcript_106114/g.332633 Transcript_106114/m.332633 type:complete len:299 (-) Transcript_106114:99-995(-)